MERYVIVMAIGGKRYGVCRRYIDRFSAVDYLLPLQRVYGGRVTCTGVIIYDTRAEAERFINMYTREFMIDNVSVCKYNPGLNHITLEGDE